MKLSKLYGLISIALVITNSTFCYAVPSNQLPPEILNKYKNIPAKKLKKPLPYKEGEVIVKYKKFISVKQAKSLSSMMGLKVSKAFETLSKAQKGAYVQIRSKTLSTEELVEILKKDPNVEYVEPNYIHYPNKVPNDPKFGKLWGQHNTAQDIVGTVGTADADMDAPETWDITTGTDDVVIAVIDTGVDYLHEDLKVNMWVNKHEIAGNGLDDDNNGYIDDIHGINAIDGSGDPMDILKEHGEHGTHVAGTIAAVGNNGKGVVGVSWNAKIMALKFLGEGGGATSDAIECLEYVITQKKAGVNIVATNNSWGGGGFEQSLHDAIQATNDLGILFIAAAGNEGADNDQGDHYPSSYDLNGIISVAATDQDDALASFSNYGATSVDLAAPGTNILSSIPRGLLPKATDIFFDDMESGTDNWVTGGTNNTWTITTDQELFDNANYPMPSSTHCWSDSPGADYAKDTDSYLMLKNDLDLSTYGAGSHVYIAIGAAAYIENGYDHATIEVSGDSGNTWATLYDFTGHANYWRISYSFELPDAVKTAHFRMRFHMKSDGSVQHVGWLIDNIGIGTELTSLYEYMQGTSMATPQVSGAVAVIAGLYSGDTITQRKARLLDNVTPVNSLNGKMVTGGRLNLKNAVGEGIKCPDGKHFNQGTNQCMEGTAISDPDMTDKPICGSGERLKQGTDICISGTESNDPGTYPAKTTCPEGKYLEQGTSQCI